MCAGVGRCPLHRKKARKSVGDRTRRASLSLSLSLSVALARRKAATVSTSAGTSNNYRDICKNGTFVYRNMTVIQEQVVETAQQHCVVLIYLNT